MRDPRVINKLIDIVGEENTLSGADAVASYTMDGLSPGAVIFPSDIEQISEVLRFASLESLAVIPTGSGTKRGLGNSPVKADIALSTKNLCRVIEHESADLVATAECGITLAEFQRSLKERNQFLPVDPAHEKRGATLGGIIAANDSGPMRLRYGTLRELLIGIKVVRADGTVFKGGSKVVKNVAGYDLPKLFVGSLGTLGVVAEATFRLYPVPEFSETYLAGFESPDKAHATVMSLLNSDLVISSLEHISPALFAEVSERMGLDIKGGYALAVRIMNVKKAVRDQMSVVTQACGKDAGDGLVIEGEKEVEFWDEIRDFPWNLSGERRVVAKASVLIADVPALFRALERLSAESGVLSYASARAGSGIVVISIEGEGDSLVRGISELRDFTRGAAGHLVIQEAPSEIKSTLGAWGDMGSAAGIMKRIKSNFDPGNILNPGRLF